MGLPAPYRVATVASRAAGRRLKILVGSVLEYLRRSPAALLTGPAVFHALNDWRTKGAALRATEAGMALPRGRDLPPALYQNSQTLTHAASAPLGHSLQKRTVVQWDKGAVLGRDGGTDESMFPQFGITRNADRTRCATITSTTAADTPEISALRAHKQV